MIAPVLVTERLIMRAHTARDFEASYAIWSNPIVTRFIGGKPSTRTQSWSRILNYAGLWQLMRFGYWAVEEKASGQLLGDVGFADFKRDIDGAMCDVPEMGWVFAPNAHGNGYATEAVSAALRWGDEHLAGVRTVCMIDVDNVASIRVAEKVGYRAFGAAAINGTDVTFYERFRSSGPGPQSAVHAGISAEDVARAGTALRIALGLPAERFATEAFVGMMSDEIELLRASGKTDAMISDLLKDAGITLTTEAIERYYAVPAARGRPPSE